MMQFINQNFRMVFSFSFYFKIGSILSKESLMQLFEALINRSREIIQKAFVLLSLPAFKICCAIVLFWIDSFTKYTGINLVFEVSRILFLILFE